jgi:hypothetical protein
MNVPISIVGALAILPVILLAAFLADCPLSPCERGIENCRQEFFPVRASSSDDGNVTPS